MLKNLSMDSGLLRIKFKTLPVVDKAPKPLQPHLLCSPPPCSLLASDLASPLILGEALFSYFKAFALLLPLPGAPPLFPQVCTWLTPLVTEAQLKHHFLSEASLALPNQTAPRPFVLSVLYLLHVVHSSHYYLKLSYFVCLPIYWLSLPSDCIFQINRDLFRHIHHRDFSTWHKVQ